MTDFYITEQTPRATTKPLPGISIKGSAKAHQWKYTLRLEHPDLKPILQPHQIDQLDDLAAMDHARGCEAGVAPVPTKPARAKNTSVLSWGFLTREHAIAMMEIAARYVAENAGAQGITVNFIREVA